MNYTINSAEIKNSVTNSKIVIFQNELEFFISIKKNETPKNLISERNKIKLITQLLAICNADSIETTAVITTKKR
jgi:hypothetical protein